MLNRVAAPRGGAPAAVASHAVDGVLSDDVDGDSPPAAAFTADDAEALLAWAAPAASARALAACLYALVCARAFLYGAHVVQPVTLAAGAAGAALAAAVAAPAAAAGRDALAAALRARGVRWAAARRAAAPRPPLDARVAAAVAAALDAAHAAAAPVVVAVAVVVARRVTGAVGGRAGQVWTGVGLYLLAAAAEARVATNATLAGVALCAAFGAAPAAAALAGGADAVAVEALAAARALVAADGRTAALAAGAAAAVLAGVPVGWLARATLAAGAAGAVLVGRRQHKVEDGE